LKRGGGLSGGVVEGSSSSDSKNASKLSFSKAAADGVASDVALADVGALGMFGLEVKGMAPAVSVTDAGIAGEVTVDCTDAVEAGNCVVIEVVDVDAGAEVVVVVVDIGDTDGGTICFFLSGFVLSIEGLPVVLFFTIVFLHSFKSLFTAVVGVEIGFTIGGVDVTFCVGVGDGVEADVDGDVEVEVFVEESVCVIADVIGESAFADLDLETRLLKRKNP